jgi:hypothetical protein
MSLLFGVMLITPFVILGQVTQTEQPKQAPKAGQSLKPPAPSQEEITEARELLGALGYWVNFDVKGTDASLRHALIAFQKIENRPRTGVLTKEELEALRNACRPQALESGYAHIEIDLNRQVLFVVDCCGAILRILPVSTGSGEYFTEGGWTRQAVTPLGRFKVTRKLKGWRKSPLGLLYYPNYIYDGIAIHGNPTVPAEPASHGCIRIPMFAAIEFYEMATIGMDVIVYDSSQISPLLIPPLSSSR